MDDVYWSDDESEDEDEEAKLDDYDAAMAKLKNDQVNSSLGLNSPGTPLHTMAEEGAVRRAPQPLKL